MNRFWENSKNIVVSNFNTFYQTSIYYAVAFTGTYYLRYFCFITAFREASEGTTAVI